MRVVVVGGTGLIGRNCVERLLRGGAKEGITSVRLVARHVDVVADLAAAGVELMPGDVTNSTFSRRAVTGMDVVINCAGRSGIGGPLRLYQSNIEITATLLDAALSAKVYRFIHIGSPSIYFDLTNALNRGEDYRPQRLADGYSESKFISDGMVLKANASGFGTLSIRPRFTSGRGDIRFLPRFIRLHELGLLRRIGSGQNMADFTAIANLSEAIFLSIRAPHEACGKAYNITNDAPVNFWDFLDNVMAAVGLKSIRGSVPYWATYFAGWAVEKLSLVGEREPGLSRLSAAVLSHSMTMSTERAKTELGYQPLQSNREMLAEFSNWYLALRARADNGAT